MQARRLAAIAEADETFMRRSYKGSRSLKRPPRQRGGGTKKSRRGRDPDDEVGVLVMRDREGHTLSNALETVDHQSIDDTVGHRLEREAALCTDGASVYQRYAQHRGVTHEPVNLAQGIRVRRPAFHGQNVNAYHSRWKGWLERLHGVATRYLVSVQKRRFHAASRGYAGPAEPAHRGRSVTTGPIQRHLAGNGG